VLAAVISFLSPSAATAQTIAACPTGATMTITAPTAAAPTTVNVTITPVQNIKAAATADATSLHMHYFIDTPATAAGATIPSGDPKILHSGTTTQDLGTLAAGSHTVIAVLGQLNHTACDTRATVTFTTAAATTTAAPAAAPAKTGNAGLAQDGSASMLLVGSLVGVAFVLTVGARKVSRRRS
jgi:hypothetical protein